MQEKLIIILSGIKIRKYDFLRFEVKEYGDLPGYKIEFHELIDYVYPGFSQMFTNSYQSEIIKKFSNFKDWETRISLLKKKYGDNILIINFVSSYNFKSLRINYLIKKIKIKSIIFSYLNHPSDKTGSIFYKLKWFIKNLIYNRKKILIYIENRLSSFTAKNLKFTPDYFLKGGEQVNIIEEKNNSKKIIKGHSLDYNMYLKYKNKTYDRKEKYGLFLEAPSPVNNIGDSFITGENNRNFKGTPEKWLNSLNNFFDFIEKKLDLKILIAPHPKIKHSDKYSAYYNGREILDHELYQTAKNAKVIISRDSAGFSYAAIYKIPAIFIYTSELLSKKNNFLDNQKNFAEALGLEPINIDLKIPDKKLKKIMEFEEEKYLKYIQNYLTSRNDNKLNFEIISEIL